MFPISTILEKLRIRRLTMRVEQIAGLYRDPCYTVYPDAMEIGKRRQRVLVLTPHADDETFGAGAAIHRHVVSGDDVEVVVFSDNIASIAAGKMEPEHIREMRSREFQEAMRTLGVTKYMELMLPYTEFMENPSKNTLLTSHLVENQPDVLYLPSLFDNHQDHRTLNLWAGNALKHIPHNAPVCRGYEVWTPLPATTVLDVTVDYEIKQKAMLCYRSQIQTIRYDHHISGLNAYRAITFGNTAKYAEAFFEAPAEKYIMLIEKYLVS